MRKYALCFLALLSMLFFTSCPVPVPEEPDTCDVKIVNNLPANNDLVAAYITSDYYYYYYYWEVYNLLPGPISSGGSFDVGDVVTNYYYVTIEAYNEVNGTVTFYRLYDVEFRQNTTIFTVDNVNGLTVTYL